MSPAASTARADRDGVYAIGQRDVGICGRALDARVISDIVVGGAESSEERRIGSQFSSWSAAQQLDLPLQFPLGAVACRFHLIADARGDAVAQSGFQLGQFFLAF